VSRARKILLAIALLSAWTLGVGSSASASVCQNAALASTALSPAQIESSVGCLMNEERTARGLDPLQPDGALHAAALSHSADMVSQGYFEHTSPAGLTFIDRIEATGYFHGTRSWSVGENLIWGTVQFSTPQSMVRAWMASPPHRENVLRGRFQDVGIAAVPGTPEPNSDPSGITITAEYGDRVIGKRVSKAKRTNAADARRS
jgi:uncharacterized protein YkwD